MVHDTVAPTMVITVPDTVPVRFTVAFSATDTAAGVQHYDVQFKVGESGVWANWLVDTLKSEMDFIGTPGEVYYFRAQATDKVNNLSAWVEVGPIEVKAVTKYYALGGQKVAMRQGEEVYFLHGDHLGSTSLTTDGVGVVVSEMRYHPYGEERWVNGEAVTDFGFTGQRSEKGFGLVDYNARYYSPVLGRFISPDSIVPEPTESGGFNRYRYARNNPLKYVDPSGHCSSLSGVAWTVCAETVLTIAPAVHKANEYRDDIFFPSANTTTWDRVEAATIVGGGPVLAVGGVMLAPVATPYVYSAHAAATAAVAAHPVAAAAAGGAIETAVECSLTGGGCNGLDYAIGVGTAGLAHRTSAPCSFSYDTLVMTQNGLRPIGTVAINDLVLAYDEVTGQTGWYPISAVWDEWHQVVIYLTIDGELIETTSEHPFYTAEGEWIAAGVLQVGEQIRRADGRYGLVEGIEFVATPQMMYNLTVDEAHTYFVGVSGWLVHNACDPYEVGQYNDLVNKSNPYDNIEIHHVPQKHPAAQVVPGYNQNTGSAIALPGPEHRGIPTRRGGYTGTSSDLIAEDIDMLRTNTNAPESAIQELIRLIDKKYPGAR